MKGDQDKTKAELIEELEALRLRLDDESDRYREMVMGLPQIVYEMDLEGRFTFVNPFAAQAFGYTPQDVADGLCISQIMHPDSLPRARQNMALAIHGTPTSGEEYIGLRKDGSPFAVKVYSRGIFRNGRPLGVRGVVVDITDIKEAQKALLRSESRYQLVVRGANDGIWEWELETDEVYFSPRYKEIIGYADDEFPNVADSWKDAIHPDDLERVISANMECMEGRVDLFQVEYRMRHKDGSYRWIFGRGASSRDENGKIFRLGGTHTDITEWRESQLRLSSIFEQAAVGITLASLDGIWLDANPSMTAITGYSHDELVGMPIADIIHPDDRDEDRAAMRMMVDGSMTQHHREKRFRHKDGHYVWVNLARTLRRDTDGRPLYFQSVIADIDDRKRTEQALRESEERFRDIVQYAKDGIYQCTIDGRFLTVNPAMANLFGYKTPEDMIGSINDIEAQLWVNGDDREVFLAGLIENGSLQNFEQHLKRKDGSKVWISENVRAVYDDIGDIAYYEGFIQDITERKLHERTSNALYAISRAITTTHDLQELYRAIHDILHEVIDATNFFIAMLDEKADRIVFPYFEDEVDDYYDIRNVSDPNTKGLTVQILRTGKPLLLNKGESFTPELQANIGVVGTPAASWLGVPLKQNGRIMGAMAVQNYTTPNHYTAQDVALLEVVSEQVALAIERKSNEEALTQLNEELESKVDKRTSELRSKAAELETANKRLMELDAIKSSLVSSISHELRTPLTSIRGFAKLTGKDFVRHFQALACDEVRLKKGERIRQNLEIIETEGERLTRLINDFLDINRIESGKAIWNDRFLNPCEVIRQACNAVSGSFAAKSGVDLIVDLPESMPPIHADPDKVQQVLINLLNNAYKFTLEGTVEVSATANVDTLTITVRDTGTGIEENEIPYIFDKFHRSPLGDTINVKEKGTGLGLAICKEIVEHYGGSIWVDSRLARGSAFSFTLPSIPGSETTCVA